MIGVTQESSGGDVIFEGSVLLDAEPAAAVKHPAQLFFGTQMVYLFLRLHHVLFTRLALARQLARAEAAESQGGAGLSGAHLHEEDSDEDKEASAGEVRGADGQPLLTRQRQNRYAVYLVQLQALISGTIDNTKCVTCSCTL